MAFTSGSGQEHRGDDGVVGSKTRTGIANYLKAEAGFDVIETQFTQMEAAVDNGKKYRASMSAEDKKAYVASVAGNKNATFEEKRAAQQIMHDAGLSVGKTGVDGLWGGSSSDTSKSAKLFATMTPEQVQAVTGSGLEL